MLTDSCDRRQVVSNDLHMCNAINTTSRHCNSCSPVSACLCLSTVSCKSQVAGVLVRLQRPSKGLGHVLEPSISTQIPICYNVICVFTSVRFRAPRARNGQAHSFHNSSLDTTQQSQNSMLGSQGDTAVDGKHTLERL
jgi:hypothetical protein